MSLLGLLKPRQAERRVAPRRRAQWGAWLAMPDGSAWMKCQTRDISASGVRLALDDMRGMPGTVFFLDMRHRLAYESRIAWQQSPEIGLEFLKVYRFDEAPSPALRQVIKAVCR